MESFGELGMPEAAFGIWQDGNDERSLVDIGRNLSLDFIRFAQHVQAEEVTTSTSFLEPEVLEIEHLLSDPEIGHDVNEESLNFNSRISETISSGVTHPCAVNCYAPEDLSGASMFCSANVGKQEFNSEIDEEKKLHSLCSFSTVNADCILDTGYSPSYLDYNLINETRVENSAPVFHPQDIKLDNNLDGNQDLSTAIICLPECPSDECAQLLDNLGVEELHDVFRSMFGRNTCLMDKDWLKHHILFFLKNAIDIDDNSNLLEDRSSEIDKEDGLVLIPGNYLVETVCSPLACLPGYNTVEGGQTVEAHGQSLTDVVGATSLESTTTKIDNEEDTGVVFTTYKRLKKPRKRNIHKDAEMKVQYCRTVETPLVSSRECSASLTVDKGCPVEASQSIVTTCQDPSKASEFHLSSWMPSSGRNKKEDRNLLVEDSREMKPYNLRSLSRRSSTLGTDSEDNMSDDNAIAFLERKKGVSRKHHRQWTLSEVQKLVEGVSQYGVGRWTDIKKTFFSAPSYRSSVDLKDKWRNLLRASGAQFQGKTKDPVQRKHLTPPLPQSVLRKIRELAIIHPYPRMLNDQPYLGTTTAVGTNANEASGKHKVKTSRKLC